jgi:hypothetical protein
MSHFNNKAYLVDFIKLVKKLNKEAEEKDEFSDYGYKLAIKYLRTEFSDVCSSGDVIIGEMIDLMESKDDDKLYDYIENGKDEKEKKFKQSLFENYLNSTIKYWVETTEPIKPNRWWAS